MKVRVLKRFQGQMGDGQTVWFKEGREIHIADPNLIRVLDENGMIQQLPGKYEMKVFAGEPADEYEWTMNELRVKLELAREEADRDRAARVQAEAENRRLREEVARLKRQLDSLPQTWQERLEQEGRPWGK